MRDDYKWKLNSVIFQNICQKSLTPDIFILLESLIKYQNKYLENSTLLIVQKGWLQKIPILWYAWFVRGSQLHPFYDTSPFFNFCFLTLFFHSTPFKDISYSGPNPISPSIIKTLTILNQHNNLSYTIRLKTSSKIATTTTI